MNKKHTIIMFVLVILVVFLAIYLPFSILNNSEEKTEQTQNMIENNITNNIIENMIIESTVENTIENTITKDSYKNGTNTKSNDVIDDANGTTNYNSESSKNKAIELVKNDWGKDDSVYFYVDEVKGNGKYVISVRNKSTTSVVVWYNVDLKNNKVEMQ